MRKIAMFGLAALAALTLACSSGGGTTSSVSGGEEQSAPAEAKEKTTTTAKVGQKVTLTSDILGEKTVVEVTVANAKQYKVEPGDFGSKPEHGVFLVLDVTVVCKDGTYHANPFNFKFVAKDGTVAEIALTIGFKPTMSAADLSAGQKTNGKIVFDVPKDAVADGKIQIDGTGLDYDKPAAFWAL
ncbi:hypothetical protein GCM10009682_18020 [Luedemannella flava]|uniref:DUF4352 domain-containing protein n=1 Tax=Luedemannella flava TaxID=349316 RepID=A0ABP4XWH4_9ACTN